MGLRCWQGEVEAAAAAAAAALSRRCRGCC
jgi:hypothetical protein